jgi:RNA polymerase sigma-70 factor (ECF subfamily)
VGRLNDISLATQVAVFHNRRAFDQLVREYQSPVRRFFLTQTTGNEALSDDLAQDTFLKAYTHIAQYRGTSSFLTWLTRIAYNVWYDYCRKEKGKVDGGQSPSGVPFENGKAAVNGSLLTNTSSLKMDIYTALRQLKENERTCITLQLIDGYDIAEIARIMQMKEGTVKSHLSRGKEKLANYLRQNGYDK